jgi:hypothetical protein
MPVIFRDGGYRFFFYAHEGNPRELREIEEVVERRRQEIEDAWNAFFA